MSIAENLRRYQPLVEDWNTFVAACARPLPVVLWANPLRAAALARLNDHEGLAASSPRASGDGGVTSGSAPTGDALVGVTRPAGAGALLARRLETRGHACTPLGWYPDGMKVDGLDKPGRTLEYLLGLYHVQEEASLIPVRVLAPRPGERILDLCAAPGGKTAQIAVATQCRGTLVANDVRVDRIRALRSNCERLGLLNVAMTAQDGTGFPLEAGPFDAILLDAPCSCEGNVRQGSGTGWQRPDEFLQGRSGLQATLLGRAWKLLAPGGRLVYATCTFAPEENEMVLDYSLREDARIEPVTIGGLRHAPGVTNWRGRELRPDCAHVARFWPHLNDTGGFTVALVRKEPVGERGPTNAGAEAE